MLAEVLERDASVETAAIYTRIRQAQGTAVVNFIWRHLATIDGALAWAWPRAEAALPAISQATGPVIRYADACIAEERLAGSVAVGLPHVAQDVFRTYERGNAWNMLAMTVLAALRAGVPMPPPPRAAQAAPAAPSAVPQMPRYDSLSPELQGLIDRLGNAGPAADSLVRPSLWVHLALWPELLRAVAEACVPVLASTGFRRAHARLVEETPALLGLGPVAPPGHDPEPIDVAIGRFRRRIPEMLLIGRIIVRQDEIL